MPTWPYLDLQDIAKGPKYVVKHLFVDRGIQIADKEVGPNVQALLVSRGLEKQNVFVNTAVHGNASANLVDANTFSKQLDHVHNLCSIFGIPSRSKFDKAKILLIHGNPVLWNMHVH